MHWIIYQIIQHLRCRYLHENREAFQEKMGDTLARCKKSHLAVLCKVQSCKDNGAVMQCMYQRTWSDKQKVGRMKGSF